MVAAVSAGSDGSITLRIDRQVEQLADAADHRAHGAAARRPGHLAVGELLLCAQLRLCCAAAKICCMSKPPGPIPEAYFRAASAKPTNPPLVLVFGDDLGAQFALHQRHAGQLGRRGHRHVLVVRVELLIRRWGNDAGHPERARASAPAPRPVRRRGRRRRRLGRGRPGRARAARPRAGPPRRAPPPGRAPAGWPAGGAGGGGTGPGPWRRRSPGGGSPPETARTTTFTPNTRLHHLLEQILVPAALEALDVALPGEAEGEHPFVERDHAGVADQHPGDPPLGLQRLEHAVPRLPERLRRGHAARASGAAAAPGRDDAGAPEAPGRWRRQTPGGRLRARRVRRRLRRSRLAGHRR